MQQIRDEIASETTAEQEAFDLMIRAAEKNNADVFGKAKSQCAAHFFKVMELVREYALLLKE